MIIHFRWYKCAELNFHCSKVTTEVPVCVTVILLQTSAGKASESRDAENASAQDDRDTDTKKPEEEEIAYASITFHHSANEAK